MQEAEQRVQRFLERVRRFRGYVYPYQRYLASNHYEWIEAYQAWYEQVRGRRWLPPAQKELLFITAACLLHHATGIKTHISKALDLGATEEEILETIEVAAHTGGCDVLAVAVPILQQVLESRGAPIWAAGVDQQEMPVG